MLKILILAGEASGDFLGASLIDGIQEELGSKSKIDLQGIGGPLMIDRGMKSLFEMSEISVMGLIEVFPKFFNILKIIEKVSKYALAWQPDLIITIDSPDFCLRVTKKIKQSWPEVCTVHYVAPSVWAWRPWRAKKMAKSIDHVLALLPFEPPYMKKAGMSCDFVGHPIVSQELPNQKDVSRFRHSIGASKDDIIIALLPGSRKSEIKRMGPIFSEFVKVAVKNFPNLKFVTPSPIGVIDEVNKWLDQGKLPIVQLNEMKGEANRFKREKDILFSSAVLAVATSGTVALELARIGTPMVIGYRTSFVTEKFIKNFVNLKSATLINLLTKRQDIPEFLFKKCTSENLYRTMILILTNKKLINLQLTASKEAMTKLGLGGVDPKIRAARSTLNFYIQKKRN